MTEVPLDIDHLRQWIGWTETAVDINKDLACDKPGLQRQGMQG